MSPSAHELRRELLERIGEPGLDLERAAERVAATRAARRRRRSRVLALGAGALVAVVTVAGAVLTSDDGDEVVADAPASTTTTSTSQAPPPATDGDAEPPADEEEVPEEQPLVLDAPSTEPPPQPPPPTVPASPQPAPPEPPAGVPESAVDEPLAVQVRPADPAPVAGAAVRFEITWLDPDHVGGAPRIRVDWDDPLLQPTMLGPEQLDCRSAARPFGSVEQAEVRFASPGARTVRVEVESCDARAGTAQRASAEATVEVGPPALGTSADRTVVAHAAPDAPLPGPLDRGIASFRPNEGLPVGLGQRRPTLDQRAADGPATVLVVPGDGAGRLELVWPGTACRATAEVAASPAGSARLVPLTLTC